MLAAMVFLSTSALPGCEKNDSAQPFGVTNIFMPQATVSGGSNNNYPVPAGNDSATWNYTIDSVNNKVNVLLGVCRGGTQSYDPFSVSITTNTDTVNQLILAGTLGAGTVLMPADLYTLPSSVSVGAGAVAASFNLSLDETKLKLYAGSKLVLAVSIGNPTKYQLNAKLSTTIVLVNVNALPLK